MCNQCGCKNPWRGAGPDTRKPIFTQEEITIMEVAIDSAMCFGTGILTSCQEELEDAGFKWTEAHEAYAFTYYVNNYESKGATR